MASDQVFTFETIELSGLTEKEAQLPIPEDLILRDSIVRETFETLLGQLRGNGLEAEIEPEPTSRNSPRISQSSGDEHYLSYVNLRANCVR